MLAAIFSTCLVPGNSDLKGNEKAENDMLGGIYKRSNELDATYKTLLLFLQLQLYKQACLLDINF